MQTVRYAGPLKRPSSSFPTKLCKQPPTILSCLYSLNVRYARTTKDRSSYTRGTILKKIELEFDEETFKTLKMEAQTRALAGNMWGLLDAFICRLVDKVDKGEEEWKVIQKNKENH